MNKKLSPELKIGLAVRTRRLECGWSQEDLSFEAGLHRTYIGAIERGEKNVTVKNLIKVAEALGIKCSFLLEQANL